jgi:membrane-associated phospholipid phosphatase
MEWLANIDIALLRYINLSIKNPVLDAVMPFFSGNRFFMPTAVICGLLVVWRWKARGLVFLALAGVALAVGDGLVFPAVKNAVSRLRPYETIPDLAVLVGRSKSWSMPSSHAANWFCIALVAAAFSRKSLWITLPIASLVGFSRVYNGVHYPSDVLVGAILGAGCGAAVLWSASSLWIWIGRKWFPLWWERFPSLLGSGAAAKTDAEEEEEPSFRPRNEQGPAMARHTSVDAHWIRLGYVVIVITCLARLAYLSSDAMQLSPDEAYQWHWSKHLDLSYYSKPPLIAYTQWLGTTIWGDTEFGIRFFSPIFAAILGVLLLRFFSREVNARAGFFLLLILTTAPMIAAGAVLMTVDPLSVLFWTAAMLAGWKAVREKSTAVDWLWVGLWMGLGFLSKYTALFQWLCLGIFFVLWSPARKQLARPGPWLAVVVFGICALPVIIWNYQHEWVTVAHVAEDAGAGKAWKPTLKYFFEFVGAEFGLLNPVYFVAAAWASIAMWKRNRRNPLLVYFFCMGAPLFVVYLLFTFKSRVLPNWIAPAVIPLFCVAVIYWDTRLRLGSRAIKSWLLAGISIGAVAVIFGHDTNLTAKVLKVRLPPRYDPMRRVRGWPETARMVEAGRQKILREGKPAFIIGDHYGITSQVSFYLPEARERAGTDPLVYNVSSPRPQNQFHLWPGYEHRKGENAVFVRELNLRYKKTYPAPPQLLKEFESVEEGKVLPVYQWHGKEPTRYIQFFFCRGLR